MTQLLHKNYQICEEIGRGRFGVVYRCVSNSSGHTFAVKSIDKSLTSGDSIDAQSLRAEPKILHYLSHSQHPHIVNLHSYYEDDTHLHMVLDYCPNLDLHSLIAAHGGSVPEPKARSVFVQLMRAVSHCHRHGVVHRDVKPDNVLFDERSCVRLADFGSAEVGGADGGEAVVASGVVGTPYYVAPEVLMGREYGVRVDVWSAGVVLYVMLAGFPPFDGETAVEIFEAVLRGNLRFPPRYFHHVTPGVKDLLRRMLCRDVSRRFSAEQVLRHSWMSSG